MASHATQTSSGQARNCEAPLALGKQVQRLDGVKDAEHCSLPFHPVSYLGTGRGTKPVKALTLPPPNVYLCCKCTYLEGGHTRWCSGIGSSWLCAHESILAAQGTPAKHHMHVI